MCSVRASNRHTVNIEGSLALRQIIGVAPLDRCAVRQPADQFAVDHHAPRQGLCQVVRLCVLRPDVRRIPVVPVAFGLDDAARPHDELPLLEVDRNTEAQESLLVPLSGTINLNPSRPKAGSVTLLRDCHVLVREVLRDTMPLWRVVVLRELLRGHTGLVDLNGLAVKIARLHRHNELARELDAVDVVELRTNTLAREVHREQVDVEKERIARVASEADSLDAAVVLKVAGLALVRVQRRIPVQAERRGERRADLRASDHNDKTVSGLGGLRHKGLVTADVDADQVVQSVERVCLRHLVDERRVVGVSLKFQHQ